MGERLYRISVVADMVGLTENVIRAWERRYGITEPKRTTSGYRAYTEHDVELLRRVRQLTLEGISIGEVPGLLPSLRKEIRAVAKAPATVAAADGSAVERWRVAIVDAARRGQQAEVEAVLDDALAAVSPLSAFEQLIVPAQREVGDLWHAGQLSVAQEHLVTQVVRARLVSLIHAAPPAARRHVVCACLPEEDHEIGLLGVAMRFRDAGFRVTYLGPRTPIEHLARLVSDVRPEMVAVSQVVSVDRKELRRQLSALRKELPGSVRLLVGGAGAEEHPDLVEEFGELVVSREGWARVLA